MTEPAAPLELSDLLDLVPVSNQAVRPARHKGTLILYVPIQPRWWTRAIAWLPGVQFRKERGIALDRLGEEVWSACDGQRSVEAIVDAFADRHKLRFHEARLSVMGFLKMLMQRGLIVLAPQSAAQRIGEGEPSRSELTAVGRGVPS